VESVVRSFESHPEAETDLRGHAPEDWFTLVLFWCMAGLVFLQFFSRYILNDAYAWTEELAVYGLIGVVFIGASACVRTSRHIQVDVLYRMLPARAARVMATFVDLARTAFLAYGCWLVYRFISLVGFEPMTTVFWNKAHVYWLAFAGFALMFLRSCQVTWQNWRRGYSVLERPEAYDVSQS